MRQIPARGLTDSSLESRYLSETVIPRVVEARLEPILDGIVFGTGGALALCTGGRRGRWFRAR